MLSAIDILYMVLAIILIPVGTLLSMVLYRLYRMMDRIESLLVFSERIIGYVGELEKMPAMIIEKLMRK